MRYLVFFEQGDTNYSAYVPDLPVCVAVGDTLEETRKEISAAMKFHIECLQEDGEAVPMPTSKLPDQTPSGISAEFVKVEVSEAQIALPDSAIKLLDSESKQKQDPTVELTPQTYTALIRQNEGWWIGWILEVRGVICQERTKSELLDTLQITLREILEFDKSGLSHRTEGESEKVKFSDILEFGTQKASHCTEGEFEEVKIAI